MTEPIGAIKQLALAETYVDQDTQLVLVRDSIPITPSFGVIWWRELDFGFPDVRAAVQEHPQADGTFDETRYTGARLITVSGVVLNDAYDQMPVIENWPTDILWNSSSWWCSVLSAWASPRRRYRLYFTDDSGASRYMDVRGDGFSSTYDKTSRAYREFQLSMVCPSGKIYTFAQGNGATSDGFNTQGIVPQGVEVEGRAYPETGPYTRNYPPAAEGSSQVFYLGSVPTGFVVRIYAGSTGVTGPRLTVTAPDRSERSIGLGASYTLPAKATLTIDTNARTVTMREEHSNIDVSVAQYLAAPLQWPQLYPGINYNIQGENESKRGYNGFAFTSSPAPAADMTIQILYSNADLA